ncbi:MAG: hypothetical protein FDZ75_00550, partial [Actinobacteria bacterium]
MNGTTGTPGYDPLGGFRTPEQRAAEEKAARAKRMKIGLFSVGAIALLVGSAIFNPPITNQHAFTNASDYKAANESGCTNSGEGCHGKDASRTDFN